MAPVSSLPTLTRQSAVSVPIIPDSIAIRRDAFVLSLLFFCRPCLRCVCRNTITDNSITVNSRREKHLSVITTLRQVLASLEPASHSNQTETSNDRTRAEEESQNGGKRLQGDSAGRYEHGQLG